MTISEPSFSGPSTKIPSRRITAPATVLPYSQFQTKLHAFEQSLSSGLSALSGGSTSSSGSSGGTTTTNYQSYSNCIQAANGIISR